MNKDKLLQLAVFLDKLPAEKFHFDQVVTEFDENSPDGMCGSVCCAMGRCPVLFPEEVQWSGSKCPGDALIDMTTGDSKDYLDIAMTMFGIEEYQAEALFSPGEQLLADLPRLWKDVTSKEVASNIRLFIEKEGRGDYAEDPAQKEEEYDG